MSIPETVVGAVTSAAAPAMVSAFVPPPLPAELGTAAQIAEMRTRALNSADNAKVYPWVFGGFAFMVAFFVGVNAVGRRPPRAPKPGAD